jgi:hypothetical protein
MPPAEPVEGATQVTRISDLKSVPVRAGGTAGGTCECDSLQQAMPQHLPSQVPQQHLCSRFATDRA